MCPGKDHEENPGMIYKSAVLPRRRQELRFGVFHSSGASIVLSVQIVRPGAENFERPVAFGRRDGAEVQRTEGRADGKLSVKVGVVPLAMLMWVSSCSSVSWLANPIKMQLRTIRGS